MGGHGALICALKNPGLYKSVSAFAPISNPSECPWGKKAFNGYLGNRESGEWSKWDATELAKTYSGSPIEILIDQVFKIIIKIKEKALINYFRELMIISSKINNFFRRI